MNTKHHKKKKKSTIQPVATTKIEQAVNIAIQYHQVGQFSEAEAVYRQILKIQPNNIDALHLLGVLSTQTGQHETAIRYIKQAITINSHIATFHSHLGNALQNAERYDEAIEFYKKALQIDPNLADIYTNLGGLYHKLGNYPDAAIYYQHALKFNPQSVETCNNLAAVLSEEERYEEVIFYYQQTIRLNPKLATAYAGLGNAIQRYNPSKEGIEQALICYQKALQLDPTLDSVYVGLGNAVCIQQPELSLSYFQKALALNPNSDKAKSSRGYAYLRMGRLTEGWAGHLHRPFRDKRLAKHPDVKEQVDLLPIDLTGQRFLLYREQGLGDELLFLRFACVLKQRGAWVAYQCGDKLLSLLNRQSCIDYLISENDPRPAVDHTLLIGDLPYALDTKEQIPPPLSLTSLPEQLLIMQKRLSEVGKPPYVGITWQGGVRREETVYTKHILQKEIKLAELAKALKPINATFIILQRKALASEIKELNQLLEKPVHDFSAVNDNLEEALALLDLLNDYVGVSNTNMHLMAGLGKTAKVLIPYPPDWRWMLSGEESPWFKGFKTYRQTENQAWDNVLNCLTEDLHTTLLTP